MPYDSSDEEVWEEEEVGRDDNRDGRPGFLDPTQGAPGLHVVQVLCLHLSLSGIMTFLCVLIMNYIIVLELIFMLVTSVFNPEQYDLKDFTCEIYRSWIGKIDLWTLFYISGLVHHGLCSWQVSDFICHFTLLVSCFFYVTECIVYMLQAMTL